MPNSPTSRPFTKSAVSDVDGFHGLVRNLSKVLGSSSGLDSANVNLVDLLSLMEAYVSNMSEWEMYALADYSRSYTRNLVDKGNGMSNLLILVWTPGQGSPIHDHADAHCVMKILRGQLKETLYEWPSESYVGLGLPAAPAVKKETFYGENQVTYMSDKLGLHRITNPDPEKAAVSLHLYTPPRQGCQIFDPKSGRSSHVTQCLFSKFGRRV